MKSALLFAATMMLVACQQFPPHDEESAVDATSAGTPTISYPRVDTQLGEKLYKNEEQLAHQIAAALEKAIRRHYAPGTARRDAHPKAHGCVRAEFHVDATLAPRLAKGVFIPGTTYDAWIRFSNANEDPERPDYDGDGRGMAIKLMGVPGLKLFDVESQATTQDFIMISHPVFLIDDPSDYLSLVTTVNSTNRFAKFFSPVTVPFTLGIQGLRIAYQATKKKVANPLHTRYWSMVPYQLGIGSGRQAIKFSARPCSPGEDEIPSDPDANFLRQAMVSTLNQDNACMEFLVQPRTSDAMSVENSKDEWKESDAPFFKVATITIPRQIFDSAEQNTFCENLSFNPWHALPEHRPLGGVNRLRKVIYNQISELRHTMNAAPRVEPTSE